MCIAAQQVGAQVTGRGMDHRIGGGELVLAMQIRREQRDGRVQRDDHALLYVRDDLVAGLFTGFSHQPLRQLQLHQGRHDTPSTACRAGGPPSPRRMAPVRAAGAPGRPLTACSASLRTGRPP